MTRTTVLALSLLTFNACLDSDPTGFSVTWRGTDDLTTPVCSDEATISVTFDTAADPLSETVSCDGLDGPVELEALLLDNGHQPNLFVTNVPADAVSAWVTVAVDGLTGEQRCVVDPARISLCTVLVAEAP